MAPGMGLPPPRNLPRADGGEAPRAGPPPGRVLGKLKPSFAATAQQLEGLGTKRPDPAGIVAALTGAGANSCAGGGTGAQLWRKLKAKAQITQVLRRVKRRGKAMGDELLERPELPRDFLQRAMVWSDQFVKTALIPGYSVQEPNALRTGCTLLSMQKETPISARAGLAATKLDDGTSDRGAARQRQASSSSFDPDAATADELLEHVREHEPHHYIPLAFNDGDNRSLYVTLENVKEMALHAEFGVEAAGKHGDAMKIVKTFVLDYWRETNRINSREAIILLSDMFYLCASLGPSAVTQLMNLWREMVHASREHGIKVFLEPARLTLLPFHHVFIASDALQLALCHYVRSPPDASPADGSATTRGGISRETLEGLMGMTLVAEPELRERFVRQVDEMAALCRREAPTHSLVVSMSQMDVHALATIYATFLGAWKGDATLVLKGDATLVPRFAEQPQAAESAENAVERLEKLSIVRQTVQRQVNLLLSLYSNVQGEPVPDPWEGTILSSAEHERLELFSIHMLQQLLPMKSIQEQKMLLLPRGLVRCPSLEELYLQLNAIKTRLLGPACELLVSPVTAVRQAPKVSTPKAPAYPGKKSAASNGGAEDLVWQLSVTLLSARGLKQGPHALYARIKCNAYTYKSQPVWRAVESLRSSATASFAADVMYTFHHVEERSTLEVRVLEDHPLGALLDPLVGKAVVDLAQLKGNKTRHSKWFELSKGSKVTGEICLELQMELIGATQQTSPAPARGLRRSMSGLGDAEQQSKLDFLTLSGGWQGFCWHSAATASTTFQMMEVDMIFSSGGDLPAPHQTVSGSGSDQIGNWELQAGRRYTQTSPSQVEWLKTYTSLNATFAQEEDGSGELVPPEVYFEGCMDERSNIIHGQWHMAFAMRSTFYREKENVGERYSEEELVLAGEAAVPAEIQSSGAMLSVRHPELWHGRYELIDAVTQRKHTRLHDSMDASEREQVLSESLSEKEWNEVLTNLADKVDPLWLDRPSDTNEKSALRQAIKKAERVLTEAQSAEARVSLKPEQRDKLGEWAVAEVKLPAVHVQGGFVLWQKGRPASLIYPAIAACMPSIAIASMLQPGIAAPPPPAHTERHTILLVIEATGLYNLNCMHEPANPYLVVTIGDPATGNAHRLMTQPVLDAASTIVRGRNEDGVERSELKFGANERFLVFLDGGVAELASAAQQPLRLSVTLMHKELSSVGGPPHVASELRAELQARVALALANQVREDEAAWEGEDGSERFKSQAGLVRGLMSFVRRGMGEVKEAMGMVPHDERESPTPTDPEIGSGTLDISMDLLPCAKPRSARVPLEQPIGSALQYSGLAQHEILQLLPDGLRRLKVPVGEAVLKIASVRWSADSALEGRRPHELVPSEEDRIALEKRGGAAVVSGAKKDDDDGNRSLSAENPYALKQPGSFMRYRWEESEMREVQLKVDGLYPVYEREKAVGAALRKRADTISERIEGRLFELEHAQRRAGELCGLEGLSDTIKDTYDDRLSALQPSLTPVDPEEEVLATEVDKLVARLQTAHQEASPSPEDLAATDQLEQLLEWQEYMVALWDDGFKTALEAGDLSTNPDYAHLRDELDRIQPSLGQGTRAHWDYYRSGRWRMRDMELSAYREMERLYNAMLRRYASVLAVVPAFDAALTAMLPLEYRMSRAVNKVRIGFWFRSWRLVPPDWQHGGGKYLLLPAGGPGGKARLTMRAEPLVLSGLSARKIAEFTRQAALKGPATLAAGHALADDRNAQGRQLIFADQSSGGCREIEKCLHRLSELRAKIQRALDAEEGLPPPIEPVSIIVYHIQVHSKTSAPQGVSQAGIVARLRFRSPEARSAMADRFGAPVAHDSGRPGYSQELPLGSRNHVQSLTADELAGDAHGAKSHKKKVRSKAKSKNEGGLFREACVDIFRVEFDRDLGEIFGVELRTAGPANDRNKWYVDKVVVSKVASVANISWPGAMLGAGRIGSGRSWTFMRHLPASERALAIGTGWHSFPPQATVHVVARVCDSGSLVESQVGGTAGALELFLTLVGVAGARSEPISLSRQQVIAPEKGSHVWHFILHADGDGDGEGQPLLDVVSPDGIHSVEVTHSGKGSPIFLDSLTLWCQHSDELYHFPCYEWLDENEACNFVSAGSRSTKVLNSVPLHLGLPPPPPPPPILEIREDPTDSSQQLLVITCSAGGAASMAGFSWRVQCVDEASEADPPAFLDVFDARTLSWSATSSLEWRGGLVLSEPTLEVPLRTHVRLDRRTGLRAGGYLVRAAGIHPLFGEGPWSPAARYQVSLVADEPSSPSGFLCVTKAGEVGGLQIKRPKVPPVNTAAIEVLHAFHFSLSATPQPSVPADGPNLSRRGSSAELLLLLHAADDPTAALPAVSFEEAVQPRSDRLPQALVCTGEAEVWRGTLELTPPRKGIGIAGGAWFHRPLTVANGFETDFTFRITKPPNTQRGSDGFAFVLQRDERSVAALGTSGIQLGFGGLTRSLAVQFATQPSCAERRKSPKAEGEAEDESVLCTLPEPYGQHIFLVPHALSGKECICPFTGDHFIAPEFDSLPVAPSLEYEPVDLSHHTDRLSVQSAGAHPNSSGPEASLASASLPMLDDGCPHHARIVLERDRLYDPRLPRADDAADDDDAAGIQSKGSGSSYRLLVYVDNMHAALINIEIELRDLFGQVEDWDGTMIAGFTAGTGKRAAAHAITSWSFHEVSEGRAAKVKSTGWFSGIMGF